MDLIETVEIYNGLKRPKRYVNKVLLTKENTNLMIAQKLERIRKLESGENQRGVMALYNIGSSTMCDIEKQTDQFLYLEI